jgi:hypothetical protein
MSTFARLLDEVELFFDNASQRSRSSKLPWSARAGKGNRMSSKEFTARSGAPRCNADREMSVCSTKTGHL